MSCEERAVDRYPRGGSEDIRITKSLSNWLSVSRLPDSLVDGGAFLEFVYKLNPRYKVPSRPHISSKIFTICSSDSDYEEGDSDFEFAAEKLRMNKYYLFCAMHVCILETRC